MPANRVRTGMSHPVATIRWMESTWESRELPVLDAAVRYLDEHAGQMFPRVHELAEMTGLPEEDVYRALVALEGSFVGLRKYMGPIRLTAVQEVYSEARTAVGQWPTPESLADRLVQAMAAAAEREPDEEKRGRLRSTASWLGSAGRDVLVDVTAAVVNRQIGGA